MRCCTGVPCTVCYGTVLLPTQLGKAGRLAAKREAASCSTTEYGRNMRSLTHSLWSDKCELSIQPTDDYLRSTKLNQPVLDPLGTRLLTPIQVLPHAARTAAIASNCNRNRCAVFMVRGLMR